MTRDGRVVLPALDGLDPVGFLAALGVLRLLHHRELDVRLSFDPALATAELTGVESVEEVVDHLVALVDGLPAGGLMVGLPPDLPAEKLGVSGSDPARLNEGEFRALVAATSDSETRSWVRALWTDLALGDEDRCAITPFSAPTGQQTLRSMFEKPADAVKAAPHERLDEALRSWRRVDGFTGENLDFRAVRGAADQPDGKATMTGVPAATWLALSSIPFFPMGGDGRRPRTLRWNRTRFARDRRSRLAFSWPVWRMQLDVHAIGALLVHPALDRAAELAADPAYEGERARRVRRELRALGVERVVVAHRRQLPGGKSAGVLVPIGSWS